MEHVDDYLEVAVAAAPAGGAVLVEGLQRPKEIELKSERSSIVTWADVTSQAAVFDIGSSCKERRDMPMTRRFS